MGKYRGKYKKCRKCKHAIEPMMALIETKDSCPQHIDFNGFRAVEKQTCEECENFEQRSEGDAKSNIGN